MVEEREKPATPKAGRWAGFQLTSMVAVCALVLSGLGFYRSYIYEKQALDITVTEVSYVTNQGELYMTVAFANGGNRDAALLRLEPALWGRRNNQAAAWIPLSERVHPDIPVAVPKTPTVVRAGGVELVTLSARLVPLDAEQTVAATRSGAFVGIRVATMNAQGNLFLLHHAVARLVLDEKGRIRSAEPAIHRSISGFTDFDGAPPGDQLQSNKKTPFVWADEHS
ncbi:MAG: hypothetical protein ABI868_20420 [Acidobacteriota bacterium]